MLLAQFGTGQVLYSLFYLFMFIIWFWLLVSIFGDLFRDQDESGWGKALWVIFVIALPFLGIFVYLIVRGKGMQQRAIDAAAAQQEAFSSYVQQTASAGAPADQIAKAKELLDSGTITQQEFDSIKAKALS